MPDYELLRPLDAATREALLAGARRRRFRKGEAIFHDGDPGDTLHLVAKGHVGIRLVTPIGDVALLRILRPGEHFGELAVFLPGPRTGSAVALDAVETLGLHADLVRDLRERAPLLEEAIVSSFVAEVRRLAAASVDAMYAPADKRLWRRLLDLADIYGGTGDDVEIPLTQEDVAQFAGTTRSSANRLLGMAEANGEVVMSRGRITVVDRAALARRAR